MGDGQRVGENWGWEEGGEGGLERLYSAGNKASVLQACPSRARQNSTGETLEKHDSDRDRQQ